MKLVLKNTEMPEEGGEEIMETTIITCPNCGSESVEYYHDNLDKLFYDDYFYSGVPFVYQRGYVCRECGDLLTEDFQFEISSLGVFAADDGI